MDVNGTKQFEEEVIRSKIPVLIDFWAPWCGPCRFYSPIIDEVAEAKKDKIKLVKINVDENEDIAAKYYISSIPTTFLFKDGKPKAEFVGAVPKETLEKWLSENL
ncbi:MAG: thioredoxin [Candidatus Parvarchaeota archaeon]|nr:thioredoxin [Candidatus Parvarchaeota archaeon]